MVYPLPDFSHFVTSIQNSLFSAFCQKFGFPGPPTMDELDPIDIITPNFSALLPGPGAAPPGGPSIFDYSPKTRMWHLELIEVPFCS